MILINQMSSLLSRLKKEGWKQHQGYAIKGDIRVLEHSGVTIVVVMPLLRIDPFKNLNGQIDKFFKSLERIIQKANAEEVFLPGGGTIPIPQFFLDFCKQNGVKIHVIGNDDIYKDKIPLRPG